MQKKRMGAILLVMCCILLGGCFSKAVKQKDYTSHGFNIKMDEGMTEKDVMSTTATFMNNEAVVTALKEEFTLLETIGLSKDSKIEDYMEVIIENNKVDSEPKEKDGIHYIEYEKAVSGKNYYYVSAFYKSDDAFWLVNFACEKTNKKEYQETFLKWAKTVTFSK